MKLSIDNGLSRYQAPIVAFMLFFCNEAFSGVDEVWNASPATQDTAWAQQYAAPVNPMISGNGGRVDLFNGSSTVATVGVPSTVTMIYLTLDLDGRGITQLAFDLPEAIARGNVRLYNRGGENADRPYDALVRVSSSGNTVTFRGEGIWTGSPVIKRIVGYSM